jgi:DegV family protein with EDD domain
VAVAIVTDSTSDIDPSRAQEFGVTVVPLFVIFGDRRFRDRIDLSRVQFYEMLRTEQALPETSQPTSQMFEDAFRPLASAGNDVLCITISSHLSGTINAARAAAQQLSGAKIEIYDSQSVAGGLGMMVLHARDLAQHGASVEEIVAALDRDRSAQRLFACIPDLSHLQRMGRIGRARAALGTLMKIVPVLSLKDGAVEAAAQVRTFTRAREAMLDLTLQAAGDPANARFLVMHTSAPDLAEHVMVELQHRLAGVQPRMLSIAEAGPVIATHAGVGAVGTFVSPLST